MQQAGISRQVMRQAGRKEGRQKAQVGVRQTPELETHLTRGG